MHPDDYLPMDGYKPKDKQYDFEDEDIFKEPRKVRDKNIDLKRFNIRDCHEKDPYINADDWQRQPGYYNDGKSSGDKSKKGDGKKEGDKPQSDGVSIGTSIDITFATIFGWLTPLLGFNVEVGSVGVGQSNEKAFISYGNAVGLEASIGFNVFVIIPVSESYSIDDFQGLSYAYTGNYEFISISLSGNSHSATSTDTFGDSYIVVKVGVGLGYGGSSTKTQTEFVAKRPKDITFMPTIKY
jgi:hypothetical protein